MRKLAKRVTEEFGAYSPKTVVFVAPTGYGKTEAAPYAFKRSGMPRAVHVAPMRTLVKAVYEKWLKHAAAVGLSEDDVGWQYMSGRASFGKSPYFLRRAVATTFDSFLYNLMKLPVARIDEGVAHYELPRSAIASSFVVFDEVHLYGGDPGQPDVQMFSAFLTAYVAVAENPVLIITATLPQCVVKAVEKEAGKAGVEYAYVDYEEVVDEEYEDWIKRHFSIETRVVESIEEVPSHVFSKKTLFVFNTVEKAVQFYQKIRGDGVVLIHGRFAQRDREAKEDALKLAKTVVSTQVVEVGIDIDADVVVTDAAPITSLVQRAGRACRREGAGRRVCKVYVVKGDGDGVYDPNIVKKSVEAVEAGVDWKHPREAIERVYGGCAIDLDPEAYVLLKELDTRLHLGFSDAKKLLRAFCERGRGLARDVLMVPVYVGNNPPSPEPDLMIPVGVKLAARLLELGAGLLKTGGCPGDLCEALLRGCATLHYPKYDGELGLLVEEA
ncbi:CRISPR-associated helicase Cas3' [Pyrobaculum sp. 3827-6]|uniref:CRISPR-associated helicase Cas3' n=1 Tax=Pyrobaculum sp. 3827-6 TaxID=2983604 RepID=UPI0021DAE238|nr:CRISPR-associated helicase Cas3' [Pyrobaculum sp. 3827-6]MCU7786888.1 CRISPR-associated helicase Cas3' [Pyrobaculum sp. 3827-6]